MAKIYLICGKICCGKSTYTRKLREEIGGAVVLSCDELVQNILGGDLGDKHDEITDKVRAYLLRKAFEIVRPNGSSVSNDSNDTSGSNVILEWGFWQQAYREKIQQEIKEAGIDYEWHFIDVTDERWAKNIKKRNASGAKDEYFVDDGLKEKCEMLFEKPRREFIQKWVVLD